MLILLAILTYLAVGAWLATWAFTRWLDHPGRPEDLFERAIWLGLVLTWPVVLPGWWLAYRISP